MTQELVNPVPNEVLEALSQHPSMRMVETPTGCLGLLPLVHPASGMEPQDCIFPRLTLMQPGLAIPEKVDLLPLVRRKDFTKPSMFEDNEHHQALHQLKELLEKNGWRIARGFVENAYSTQYQTVLLVEVEGKLWQLPPQPEPYPFDFPLMLAQNQEKLPKGAISFRDLQREHEMAFFPRRKGEKHPGLRWVRQYAYEPDFTVFYENNGQRKGEWVVRTLRYPDENYAGAIGRYLHYRYGAQLDFPGGRIIVNSGSPFGGGNGRPKQKEIDFLAQACGVQHLEVIQETKRGNGQRGEGERVDTTLASEILVDLRPLPPPEVEQRWRRHCLVLKDGERVWLVAKSRAGVEAYLGERFQATLNGDNTIICSSKDIAGFIIGREGWHSKLLARVCGRDKPFRVQVTDSLEKVLREELERSLPVELFLQSHEK